MVFRTFLMPRPRCTAATARRVLEAGLVRLMANLTALNALVPSV